MKKIIDVTAIKQQTPPQSSTRYGYGETGYGDTPLDITRATTKPANMKSNLITFIRSKKLWRGIAMGFIGFVLLLIAFGSYVWATTPSIDSLVEQSQSSVVFARDGQSELFKYYDEENRKVIPLEQIPKHMQLAMIGLEQENFYTDELGIPWKNLVGATVKCFTSRNECRGASGLSQQFIKNYTDDNSPSITRKVRELFTSIKLNQEKTKEDVLALYLNEVPYGRNAYGIEEAAKTYFGGTPGINGKLVEGAKDLTVVQSCFLASFPQRTTFYAKAIDPNTGALITDSSNWKELEYRKNFCLQKLKDKRLESPDIEPLIKTDDELKILQVEIPQFAPLGANQQLSHFRDFVTDELAKMGIKDSELKTRGYKITSSLDPALQQKVQELVKNYNVGKFGADNAASIVIDGPTGQILAMQGSLDYNNVAIDGQFNVVTSPQQPGSSIKPYEYAAALEQDFNPGSIVFDVATEFQPGFTPTNFNKSAYYGGVTLRSSLQNSLNTPAIKAAYLGVGSGETPDAKAATNVLFNEAEKAGVVFPCQPAVDGEVCNDAQQSRDAYKNRCFLASTIGGCELTMLSHATGINTLAQNGTLRTSTPFISIIDGRTGTDIYANLQKSDSPPYPIKERVIDPLVSRQMSLIMSDYKSRYPAFCGGTGRCGLAANLELPDRPVAAKTGTTDESRDTWTVGYTPQITALTWVGRTDNQPLGGVGAASAAAPLWNNIMLAANEGKEALDFDTSGLILTKISGKTGLLDDGGYNEWLTPAQVNALKEAQKRFNTPGYNPLQQSIFTNRTPIIGRTIQINKIDGKLAVEGKTLPENIEEKVVIQCVSEFPLDAAWRKNAGCKSDEIPTEKSDQDQVAEKDVNPEISTNLEPNEVSPKTIQVTAKLPSKSQKTISAIRILIESNVVAESKTSSLTFTPTTVAEGKKDVLIEITDSFGIKTSKIIQLVEFKKQADDGKTPIDKLKDVLNNILPGDGNGDSNEGENPTNGGTTNP